MRTTVSSGSFDWRGSSNDSNAPSSNASAAGESTTSYRSARSYRSSRSVRSSASATSRRSTQSDKRYTLRRSRNNNSDGPSTTSVPSRAVSLTKNNLSNSSDDKNNSNNNNQKKRTQLNFKAIINSVSLYRSRAIPSEKDTDCRSSGFLRIDNSAFNRTPAKTASSSTATATTTTDSDDDNPSTSSQRQSRPPLLKEDSSSSFLVRLSTMRRRAKPPPLPAPAPQPSPITPSNDPLPRVSENNITSRDSVSSACSRRFSSSSTQRRESLTRAFFPPSRSPSPKHYQSEALKGFRMEVNDLRTSLRRLSIDSSVQQPPEDRRTKGVSPAATTEGEEDPALFSSQVKILCLNVTENFRYCGRSFCTISENLEQATNQSDTNSLGSGGTSSNSRGGVASGGDTSSSTTLSAEDSRRLLNRVPKIEECFHDLKPVLTKLNEEKDENLDESLLETLDRLAIVTDFLGNIVDKAANSSSFDKVANSSLSSVPWGVGGDGGDMRQWNDTAEMALITVLELLFRGAKELKTMYAMQYVENWSMSGELRRCWQRNGFEREVAMLSGGCDGKKLRDICCMVLSRCGDWSPNVMLLMEDFNARRKGEMVAGGEVVLAPVPEMAKEYIDKKKEYVLRSRMMKLVVSKLTNNSSITNGIDENTTIENNHNNTPILAFTAIEFSPTETYGVDGMGKTTFAAMIASQDTIRQSFDFIVWIKIGKQIPIRGRSALRYDVYLDRLKSLCRQLQLSPPSFPPLVFTPTESPTVHVRQTRRLFAQARDLIASMIEGMNILMIFDDVWEEDHLSFFKFPNVKMLITTPLTSRSLGEVPSLPFGSMTSEESLELLMVEAELPVGHVSYKSEEARGIVEWCDHYPLLIKPIGKCINIKQRAVGVPDALAEVMTMIQTTLPKSCAPLSEKFFSLLDAVIDNLTGGDKRMAKQLKICHASFVTVFPESTPIPLDIVWELWSIILPKGIIEELKPDILFHIGLLRKRGDDSPPTTTAGKSTSSSTTNQQICYRLSNLMSRRYGQYLAQHYASSSWRTAATPLFLKDAKFSWNDKQFSHKYFYEYLPHHYLHTSRRDVIADLLSDVFFIKARLKKLGVVSGTKRHLRDLEEYALALVHPGISTVPSTTSDDNSDAASDDAPSTVASLHQNDDYNRRQSTTSNNFDDSVSHVSAQTTIPTLTLRVQRKLADFIHERTEQLRTTSAKNQQQSSRSRQKLRVLEGGLALLEIAQSMSQHQFWREAASTFHRASDLLKKSLGKGDTRVAGCLYGMGMLNHKLNEWERAEAVLWEALKIREMTREIESCAEIWLRFGEIAMQKCLYDEAVKFFDQSLEVREGSDVTNYYEIGRTAYYMALVNERRGEKEKSRRCLDDAVWCLESEIAEVRVEEEGMVRLLMALAKKSRGDYDDALDDLQRGLTALSKRQTNNNNISDDCTTLPYGPIEDDEVAHILNEKGRILALKQQHDNALDCHVEALQIYTSTDNQENAALALRDIGGLKAHAFKTTGGSNQEDIAQAMNYLQQSLILIKRSLGNDHTAVAAVLYEYGIVAADANRMELAIESLSDALKIWKSRLGGDSNDKYADSAHALACVYDKAGNFDSSERWFKKEVDIRKAIIGEDYINFMKDDQGGMMGGVGGGSGFIDSDDSDDEDTPDPIVLDQRWMMLARALDRVGNVYRKKKEYEDALTYLNQSLQLEKRFDSDSLNTARVYFDIGCLYYDDGEYSEAMESFEQCQRIRLKTLHYDDPLIAEVLDSIGQVYYAEADFDNAMKCFEEVLAARKFSESQNLPEVAKTLLNMGMVYFKRDELAKAMTCYNEALHWMKLEHGENHISFAEIYNLRGKVYSKKLEYKNALKNFEETIRLLYLYPDQTDPEDIADVLINKGVLNNLAGDQENALKNHIDALKIYKEKSAYNSTRPTTRGDKRNNLNIKIGDALHNMGSFYASRGDDAMALKCFDEALAMKNQSLDTDSLKIADTYYNMAFVYSSRGHFSKSLKCLNEAARIRKLKLGGTDALVGDTLNSLGKTHKAKGELEKALDYFKQALEIRLKNLGSCHQNVASTLFDMGNICDDLAKYDDAIRYLADCLEIRREMLGENHELVGSTLYTMGFVYDNMNKQHEAAEYFEKALENRKFNYGGTHIFVGDTLNVLGVTWAKIGENDKALDALKMALSIIKVAKNDEAITDTLNNLGNVYKDMGKADEAMECYREALQIRKDLLGDDGEKVADSYFNLGNMYNDMAKTDKALECYKESLWIRTMKLGNDHLKVATIHYHLGMVYYKLKEMSNAIQHMNEVVRIQKLQNRNQLNIASALVLLADMQEDCENESLAFQYLEDAENLLKQIGLHDDHKSVIMVKRKIEKYRPAAGAPLQGFGMGFLRNQAARFFQADPNDLSSVPSHDR